MSNTGGLNLNINLGGSTQAEKTAALEKAVTSIAEGLRYVDAATGDLRARIDGDDTSMADTKRELDRLSQERADEQATIDAERKEMRDTTAELRGRLEAFDKRFDDLGFDKLDDARAALQKLQGDVDLLMRNNTTDIVNVSGGTPGFDAATPSFPNGFMQFVIETYFRSDLARYNRECDAERNKG